MSEWGEISLGEGCEILDSLRVPLNADERDSIKGDVPYYGANGLQGYINNAIFDEPLILLAEDGGYFDEYETRPIAYRISGPSWVNNHAHVLRVKKDGELDQDFIFYCLQHKNLTPFIKGGTRAKLNQSELREIVVPKPPPNTQRRIATILTTVDEVIEAKEKLVEKHQQIKAGLMYDLFTRGLWTRPELARGDHPGLPCETTAQEGQLRPTPEEAPGLYQDSRLGLIPKAWAPGLLSDYLDPINGIKPGPFGSSLTKDIFTSSGFRIYGQEQVIAGNLAIGDYYISPQKFAEMRTFEVLAGDVLLSLVGTVGCVLVVEAPFEPGIINPRLLRLRPFLQKVSPQFVRHLLLTDGLRKQIDSLAGGGTMPVINGKVIRRLRVPMISTEEQKLIVTRLRSLEQSVTSSTTHLAKLRQQKQGLMHELLTGRVRVEAETAGAERKNLL